MSASEEDILLELRKKIDSQELRVFQRNIEDTRSQYEQAKKRELETSQMLAIEKTRCQNQEREICRRRKQLEESTLCIKKLQAELENARQISNGVQWELRENEIKSLADSEIVQYRTKISGLEAKLRRKQHELETAQEMLVLEQSKMNQDRDEFSSLLEQKDRALNECLEKLKKNSSFRNPESMESVHERIGALTVTVENLRCRIDSLQAEKCDLENKLRYAEEDNLLLKSEISSLKDRLTDSEGISQQTSVYLTDEIDKIKHQKAQLRGEFLQLQRENKRLESELKAANEAQNINPFQAELTTTKSRLSLLEQENKEMTEEKSCLKKQIKDLENSLKEYKLKLEHAQTSLKESEERESSTHTQLNSELENSRKKMDAMRQALLELDSQCEKLMTRIRIVDQNKKTVHEENQMLQKEAEELKKKIETHCKLENELVSIQEENQRLLSKINYLESELRESQKDYRGEISKMADQLAQTQQKMENHKESNESISVNLLESKLLQEESHRRYLERSIEQTKKESAAMNKELKDIQKRQYDLINENTTLRQALSEAIKKTEQYRDQTVELKNHNENLVSELNEINGKLMRYEDRLCVLDSELEQKEKLTSYLQSVVQPKQMQKLRREPNSQSSTLISNGSISSEIEMETQEVEVLERQRDNLRKDLEQQRRVLNERQNQQIKEPLPMELNEAVPLIRNKNTSNEPTPMRKENPSLSVNSPSRIGTMRHDIPHRWKTQFITITSSLCGVCLEGLPHFGHIYKCRECALMIHSHCSYSVVNSCGFPTACADFYLDSHSLSNGGTMTGWIKLWRSDDRAGNKWRNAWATIDENQLRFYDSDNLAVSDGSPFMSIDLVEESWKIFNQVGTPIDGIPRESMSMLIEIKLPGFTLFMLAPTVQAKQRWVRSLQCATNRRIFVQRRPSTVALFSQLLALNKPQNITINSTQILDGEWLLMGCHEGLFVTNIHSPRSPINIAGIPAIYFLELIIENDMLLAICGSTRLFAAIHLHQLRKAVRADYQPTVQYTTIANIDNCHIAVISKIEHSQKRYIYLATTEAIHILNFVEKLGVFAPFHQINTVEPCMCICSTSTGFIFGSDDFYFVSFGDFAYKTLSIDNCPSDFPIASLEINPNEYLLAFHNYGVFVSADGQRTRYENVEWDRIPLEFVYNGPYLYIVYCDFLEIARVANYEGPESRTLTDDRSMFKCRSAHRTGGGLKPTEEIFAVSTEDRVELHIFNSHDVELNNKSMKRKLVDSLSRSQNKKKY